MTTIINPSPAVRGPERQPAPSSASLRDLLNNLFFYRRAAFLIALAVLLIGVLVAVLTPPSFTSRARLLTLSSAVYDMQQEIAARSGNNATIAVDVEMQLISSPELHRAIVRKQLPPHASAEAVDAALNEFEDHLHISKLETGSVIELTYRDRSPQHAAAQLQALLTAYFEERAEVLTSGRVAFLESQRDKVKQQLDEANAQIEAYQKQNGVVDVQQQINSAVALDGTLRQQEAEAEAALADSRRSVEVLKTNADNVPREVELYSDNAEAARTVGAMESQLFQLEAKRADLASRYMSTSPFVKQTDDQIAQLQASIAQQKTDVTVAKRTGYNTYKDTVTDRLSSAQALLAGATARREVLSNQVDASKNRLKNLISISDTLSRLTQERDLLAGTFKDYNDQLEQARIQQNQNTSVGTTNVRVIEAPVPPRKRGNPPIMIIAASLAAALAIAAVALVVLTSMRDTFLSPEEAERSLHLPVLCDLARRDAVNAPARRDYGRLIAALDSIPTGGLGKTVLILSTNTEGKLNLVAQGLMAALEPRAPGRIALVRMEEDGEVPAEGTPVKLRSLSAQHVMTIGMNMTRTRLTNLFHEFRSSYDYVVITAPPASSWFESLELTTVADLSLLVVQAEETRLLVASNVIAQAGYIGGEISGLALTGRRYYIPAWIYRLLLNRNAT